MVQLTQEDREFMTKTLKPYLKKNDWDGVRNTLSSLYGDQAKKIIAFCLENDAPAFKGLDRIPNEYLQESDISKVKIPGSIKIIGERAFKDCKELRSVTIEDGVEVILSSAFEGTPIVELTLPESVREIRNGAFANTSLRKINIPDTVTDLFKDTFLNCPDDLVIYATSRKDMPVQYKLKVPSEDVEFYKSHLKMKGEEE